MSGVCLDSTYCIDFLSGTDSSVVKAMEWEKDHVALFVPAPVAMEVLSWGRGHGEEAFQRSMELLNRGEVLNSTLEVALEASRMGVVCSRRGATVPSMDLMIAATAKLNRLSLVTHDPDFHRIPGLTLESY